VNGIPHGFLLSGGVYTTIDVPGSTGTIAYGINNSGEIVGEYFVGGGVTPHGFLYSEGIFTPLDVPGAISTYASGINDAGEIVGSYTDANFGLHGFLASAIPEPSSLTLFGLGTLVVIGYTWRQRTHAQRGGQKEAS